MIDSTNTVPPATVTVQQPANQQVAPQADQPTISLEDFYNILQILDFACDQGAFKGWTIINQVAGVRNKLYAFLAMAMPNFEEMRKQQANAQQQGQAATPAVAPKAPVTKKAPAVKAKNKAKNVKGRR